ncbi:MAG TPA: 4Fe-4S binding protein [Patescibacteria group bacterium]|nr:4Fe-4S binding protein [Patescibacteria group bacterium]
MKKNLAVSPGTTKKNKTGGWRTYGPEIDQSRCIGCGQCAQVCPEGCIFPVGDKALQGKIVYEKDLDYCKGCGLCAAKCPVKCIEMKLEDK